MKKIKFLIVIGASFLLISCGKGSTINMEPTQVQTENAGASVKYNKIESSEHDELQITEERENFDYAAYQHLLNDIKKETD